MMNGFILQENTSILISRNGKTLYSILHRSLDLTEFMEEVLIDDNMVFDIDNLKGFLNDTSSFGFIAKENNKIIGFAYCYTLLRPMEKQCFIYTQ